VPGPRADRRVRVALPQHAIHVADKVLLMHDVDDYAFGSAATAMTEEALGRLYGIANA
jgi:iron complex transport system ATP-binding protein